MLQTTVYRDRGHRSELGSSDADLYAASLPPRITRFAAVGPAVLGVLLIYFAFYSGVAGSRSLASADVLLVAMGVLGAAHVLLAFPIARARVPAIVAALALSPLALLVSAGLARSGAFAGILGAILAAANLVLLGLSVGPSRRVARAERDLLARHPEEAFVRKRPHLAVPSVLAALAVFAAMGAVAVWRSATHTTAADAFAGSAFGQALAEPLTDFVVALGRDPGSKRAASARDALLSKDVAKQIGPDAMTQLRGVLDGARRYARESVDHESATEGSFWSAIDTFDAKLAERGVPGFLGAYAAGTEDQPRSVWVLGYRVRSRATVHVGGKEVPVVRAARLDSLNYVDPEASHMLRSRWIVLSMDALEQEFVRDELPAIVRGEPLRLTEETPEANDLGRRASALIADEVLKGSPMTKDAAVAIDGLLAVRDANAETLRTKNYAFTYSRRFRLDGPTAQALRLYDSDFVVRQLLKNDEELGSYGDVVDAAVDLLADDQETEFAARVLLEDPNDDARRNVLEAELLALAQPSRAPRLALWRAARGEYGLRTAATLFDALFLELGLTDGKPWDAQGFRAMLLKALELEPALVQAAARRAYVRLIGTDAPAYARTEMGAAPR